MKAAMECGNRRAEIDEVEVPDLPLFNRVKYLVTFSRMSGRVRRSKHGVWKVFTDDARKAKRLAKRWVSGCKLGDPVLRGA